MKLFLVLLIASLLISFSLEAQEPYAIPFASSGNLVELTVSNTSTITASGIKVEARSAPAWLQFANSVQLIDLIGAQEEQVSSFSFSVDKTAPVNKEFTVAFVITNSAGEIWTKEIMVKVAPPQAFELFQNYPNPFNPATTISYQLPINTMLTLRVYDILGREVAVLVDGAQVAGYHQATLNASSLSSGVYIYSLEYTDGLGHRQVLRKTMMLVK